MTVRKIVVGVDHETLGDAALRAAFALASSAGDTQVHAVHVRSPLEGFPVTGGTVNRIDGDLDRLRARIDVVLGDWRDEHGDPPIPEVTGHVVSGRPATALIRVAAGLAAGLIIVGTHGRRGLARAVMGSVANEVVTKATCPVLVVRGIDHGDADRISEIEPPCPECQAQRVASGGAVLWCERHAEHHPRAHVYGYTARPSDSIRPWGF